MTLKKQKQPILTQAYWERPPARAVGDDDPNKIYRAVGFATTHWELADQAMSWLFLELSGVKGNELASMATKRVYGAIFGNAGRRAAVLAAAEVYFGKHWLNKPVRQSLIDITNAVQWASVLRDDVVHGVEWSNLDFGDHPKGAFLVPPDYNTGRTYALFQDENDPFGFLMAHYRYVGEDIEKIADQFQQLRKVLTNYTVQLRKNGDGAIPLVLTILAEQAEAGKKK